MEQKPEENPSGEISSSEIQEKGSGEEQAAVEEVTAEELTDPETNRDVLFLNSNVREKIVGKIAEIEDSLKRILNGNLGEIEATRYFTHPIDVDWNVSIGIDVKVRKK